MAHRPGHLEYFGKSVRNVSDYEHISHVCKWHDEERQAPPIGPDREWAKRWLLEQERAGILTAAEVAKIQKQRGWPSQLPLFT
jgi:hypothetical protein